MSEDVADRQFGGSALRAVARGWSQSGVTVGVLAVSALTILLSVSGAYDTDDLGLARRTLFWFIFSSLVIGQVCAFDRLLSAKLCSSRLMPLLAGAGAIALTIVLTAVEVHALKFTPLLPKEPDPLLQFILFVAPPVAAIGLVTLIFRHRLIPEGGARSDAFEAAARTSCEDAETVEAERTYLLNLSDLASDRILRVRSHDHYLEVQTDEATHFVRGRMKDVVECLPRERGLQIHRSWWVAFDHIAAVQPAGRDRQIVLNDGAEVPVARSRFAALRKAGLVKGM